MHSGVNDLDYFNYCYISVKVDDNCLSIFFKGTGEMNQINDRDFFQEATLTICSSLDVNKALEKWNPFFLENVHPLFQSLVDMTAKNRMMRPPITTSRVRIRLRLIAGLFWTRGLPGAG